MAAALFYTNRPLPLPQANTSPTTAQLEICKEFQKVNYIITCEKAVELALAQAQGKIQKVSIGPVKTRATSSSGAIEKRTVDMWLIDIVLTKPYFDDNFKKQINVLQIGIPQDDTKLVYKKPLQ